MDRSPEGGIGISRPGFPMLLKTNPLAALVMRLVLERPAPFPKKAFPEPVVLK